MLILILWSSFSFAVEMDIANLPEFNQSFVPALEFHKIPSSCKRTTSFLGRDINVPEDYAKRLERKQKKYCNRGISFKKLATTFTEQMAINIANLVLVRKITSWLQPRGGSHGNHSDYAEQNVIATGVQSTVNNLVNAYKTSRRNQSEGLQEVHDELKKESSEYVRLLPQDFQNAITALDNRISTDLSNQQGDVALKKIRRREEVLLSFPHLLLNVAQYDKMGDVGCRSLIDENVDRLMNSYPPENHEILQVLIDQIRDNSFLPTANPAQAYLYGPPGTGKTTFVRRLGAALGLPVCEIAMNNLESQGLLGIDHEDSWVSMEDFKVIGRVADCFRKSKYNNPIIFFDEASGIMSGGQASKGYDYSSMKTKMLQEDFKKLLDPTNRKMLLSGVGVSIDVSRATFIAAGNFPISNDALLSRFPQIVFRKLEDNEKRQASMVAFKEVFASFENFLTQEEIKEIRQVTQEYLEFILEEDEERNPGARVVQAVIQEFAQHVRTLVTKKRPITEKKLREFIMKSFERREKLATP